MAVAELKTPKYFSLDEAVEVRRTLKASGKKVVLTNGCFDLLHVGHLYYLQQAAALGDSLWIALNSDDSIRSLKGPQRPILSLKERAYALGALSFVGGLFSFENPRLTDEIRAFEPDVYVKAGDYTLETLDRSEREALEEVGAQISFLPFLDGYSTTNLIEKIRSLGKSDD